MNMSISNFLLAFREYFQLFMKIYSDKRKFDLLPYDFKGYFSDFVKKSDNFTFSCLYDLERIEIYYKEEKINKNYISNSDFHLNEEVLSDIARYLATHEYGHTFFCDSVYTSKILLEQQLLLKNNYNFLFLIVLFNEFSAEWHAYRMMVRLPEILIRMFLKAFKILLGEFFVTRIGHTLPSTPSKLKYFDYYQWYFKELIRLYAFRQWSRVEPLFNHLYFNKRPFILLEKYCEKLFHVFEHLYNYTNRESLILKSLTTLAERLSEITLWNLVSENITQEELEKIVNIELEK